jgi:hypothetical protein
MARVKNEIKMASGWRPFNIAQSMVSTLECPVETLLSTKLRIARDSINIVDFISIMLYAEENGRVSYSLKEGLPCITIYFKDSSKLQVVECQILKDKVGPRILIK